MFRRKEENSSEMMPNETAAAPANSNSVAMPSASSVAPSSASPFSSESTTPASSMSMPGSFAPAARPAEPARPQAPAAQSTPYRASPMSEPSRPARQPEPAARPAASSSSDKAVKANRRVLTVGNDIILRGEVTTCDRLVIEGKVDAKISDVHTVEIAETGSFKGQAEVEEAEISGTFDGDIIVRGRLVIYSTGKVRGKITYGEIEIERGGEISGEIKTMAAGSTKGSKSVSSFDERQKSLPHTVAA